MSNGLWSTMPRMTRLQRPGRWSTISCLLAVGFVVLGMSIPRLAIAETPAELAQSEAASAPVVVEESTGLDSKHSWVKSALTNYGPWLLFGLLMASGVGMALGEDAFIIPAGFLMEQELMPFWWTIAAAYFGVVFADTLWMLIVRQFSGAIMRFRFFRRMFHPRRILEVKYKFDRWGDMGRGSQSFHPLLSNPRVHGGRAGEDEDLEVHDRGIAVRCSGRRHAARIRLADQQGRDVDDHEAEACPGDDPGRGHSDHRSRDALVLVATEKTQDQGSQGSCRVVA